MINRAALLICAAVVGACQASPPPDRHVLWSGTDVPLSHTRIVSTHDSKAACATARDAYAASLRPPGQATAKLDAGGVLYLVKDGTPHGVVCHPVGVTPG